MAVETTTPVAVESANYFDLAYWTFTNLLTGTPPDDPPAGTPVAELRVCFNAWLLEDAPTEENPTARKATLVQHGDPVLYTGERLDAILADMDAKTQAHKTAGVPAGVAELIGQRDAIQAALTADGHYPAGTATGGRTL